MKICLTFLIFPIWVTVASGQQKNSIYVEYGAAYDVVGGIGTGGPGYVGKGEAVYGLNYTRRLNKSVSLETGLEYSVNKLLWNYIDVYDPSFTPQKFNVRMFSVPLYANFTFLKYLFIDGGITLDFESGSQQNGLTSAQNGIGLGLGIGAKYNFKKITIFLNPFAQIHTDISFGKNGSGYIGDQGIKAAIGYSF